MAGGLFVGSDMQVKHESAGLPPKSPHLAIHDVCSRVAAAISAALPPGFRGKFVIIVDKPQILPHDVAVEIRPPQPKAGMTGARPSTGDRGSTMP